MPPRRRQQPKEHTNYTNYASNEPVKPVATDIQSVKQRFRGYAYTKNTDTITSYATKAENKKVVRDSLQPVPADAHVIQSILETSKGVKDYDPRIIDQLLSFMHRYSSVVLQDAHEISKEIEGAGGSAGGAGAGADVKVTTDDVALAMRLQGHSSFVDPPTLKSLGELAGCVNRIALPPIAERHGLRIPQDERECLTAPNFQLPKKTATGRKRKL
jgi:hypothetical protein